MVFNYFKDIQNKSEEERRRASKIVAASLFVIILAIFLITGAGLRNLGKEKKTDNVPEKGLIDVLSGLGSSLKAGVKNIKESFSQGKENIDKTLQNAYENPANPNASGALNASSWRTYSNPDYGFELSYPAGWEVKTNQSQDYLVSFGPADLYLNPDYTGDFSIRVGLMDATANFKDYYAKEAPVNLFVNSKSQVSFSVNGFEAVKFIDAFGFTAGTVIAVKDGALVVELNDLNNGHQQDGIFDSIVSSFRFIK